MVSAQIALIVPANHAFFTAVRIVLTSLLPTDIIDA